MPDVLRLIGRRLQRCPFVRFAGNAVVREKRPRNGGAIKAHSPPALQNLPKSASQQACLNPLGQRLKQPRILSPRPAMHLGLHESSISNAEEARGAALLSQVVIHEIAEEYANCLDRKPHRKGPPFNQLAKRNRFRYGFRKIKRKSRFQPSF